MILIDTLNPFVPLTTCNGNGHIRGTLLDPHWSKYRMCVYLETWTKSNWIKYIKQTTPKGDKVRDQMIHLSSSGWIYLDQLMDSPEGFRFKVIVKWYYHRFNSALLAKLFSIYWNAERVRFGKLQYLKSAKGILLATLLLQHLHHPQL